MIRASWFVLVASVVLFAFGCGSDDDEGVCAAGEVECDGVCIAEFSATLTDIQTNVFDVSCAASSCHDNQNPAAGLDLSTAEESAAGLINVASTEVGPQLLVEPFEVEGSYLFEKIAEEEPAVGGRMPLGGIPLCQAKIDAVEFWIADGAPE